MLLIFGLLLVFIGGALFGVVLMAVVAADTYNRLVSARRLGRQWVGHDDSHEFGDALLLAVGDDQ